MNKVEFFDYLKENVVKILNESNETDEYEAEVAKNIKNNGIVLNSLAIRKKDESVGPNIYIDDYYECYCMGKPVSIIINEIVEQCIPAIKKSNNIKIDNIFDFEAVKDNIIVKLVNFEKNAEMLQQSPHVQVLDLAVTFRYLVEKDSNSIASSIISQEIFEKWNTDIEELYQIAISNTERIFPCSICSLLETIKAMVPDNMDTIEMVPVDNESLEMFILTNESSAINGAACILYDSVLKDFAKEKDCNLFILPSSIHEIILVPERGNVEPESLKSVILDVNQSVLDPEDFLSDSMYYYDREKDEIHIYE